MNKNNKKDEDRDYITEFLKEWIPRAVCNICNTHLKLNYPERTWYCSGCKKTFTNQEMLVDTAAILNEIHKQIVDRLELIGEKKGEKE